MSILYIIVIVVFTLFIGSLNRTDKKQNHPYPHLQRDINRYAKEFKKIRLSTPQKPASKRRRKPRKA